MDDGAPQQAYEPPAPFAPPALRTPPLNEWHVLGRTTYPVSPMQPVPYQPIQPYQAFPPHLPGGAARPGGPWTVGQGWVPAPARGAQRTARRRTIAVVAAVVLALLAVIGVLSAGAAGPSGHSLSLPDSAGPYVRVSTIDGSHVSTIVGNNGTFGSIPSSDLEKAKIAVYARGAQAAPSALFLGFDASDSPTIGQQLRSEDAAQVTREVLAGAGAAGNADTVDAGPLGGSLECSAVHVDGVDATVGVWADSDTLGLVLLFGPTLGPSLSQTGAVTRAFRAQAEH